MRVTTGKDKGKEGKVTQTFPERGLVVVDGVRQTTRHLSPKRAGAAGKGQKGQKVTYFSPIRVANVVVVTPKGAGRIGVAIAADGTKRRVVRKAGKVLELA